MMPGLVDLALAAPLSLLPVPVSRRIVAGGRTAELGGTSSHPQRLFIDVSVIVRDDARTGIQRVVRALLMQLLMQPPEGFEVRAVYASKYKGYRYAPSLPGMASSAEEFGGEKVCVSDGDVFLGLDLSAHLIPRHSGQLARWKRQGVKLVFVVYDLLPLLQPQWFNERTQHNFRRWIRAMAMLADGAICISENVKFELQEWLTQRCGLATGAISLHHIHLGGDLHATAPTQGLQEGFGAWLEGLKRRPTILMVGTVEPRKGHAQALAAFDLLWRRGFELNLVIAGKPGWKVDDLLSALHAHPQSGDHLHFLEHPSDEELDALYRMTDGVLMASEAEGFGLPLVEAASYGKPVLARDIPVFREVGADLAHYFSGRDPASLAAALTQWLSDCRNCETRLPIPWLTWKESADQLAQCVLATTRD